RIGLKHVIADLTAECHLAFLVVNPIDGREPLLLLQLVKLGFQKRERVAIVFDLAAFAAALRRNTCRSMRVAHAGLGLVLMLATGAAGAKRVAAQIAIAQFDLDRVIEFGRNIDGRETCLPSVAGAEGTDPHKPMNPRLTL